MVGVTGKPNSGSIFWPPQDEDPGCEYVDQAADIVTAVGGDLDIRSSGGAASTQLVAAPETAHRTVIGEFGFPSPKEWGVDLWITQDFDVRELNPESHAAEGTINWGVYDVLQRQWKLVKADAKYVFFDESGQSAIVMAAITAKIGEGEGEPGEYASFWVHDGGAQDRFGIQYFSDFHPEVGFKEFFPADQLPPLEYAEPAELIAVETGDVTVGQ